MTDRAVLFSGGVGHPFDETSPLLAELIGESGLETRIETDLDAALGELRGARLLAVNALYWTMTQHEKYAPLREQWATSLSDAHMQIIHDFVSDGGRLFVLHTGTICWDNQPGWLQLMGGGWDWQQSHHPRLGKFTVALTQIGSRMANGAVSFEVVDEAYHNLAPGADCTVLATADLGQGPQPLAWLRGTGRGKVAVDALGHDSRSLTQPVHRRLIRGQLDWLNE